MDTISIIRYGWNDERISTLEKLWLDGLSASQIAKQLGGITRNAVIGKLHRLGLSGRAAPARPVCKAPRASRAQSLPPPQKKFYKAVETTVIDMPEPATSVARPQYACLAASSAAIYSLGAHMCKWPIGDPAMDGFSFCGRRSGNDGPYCSEHALLAYQPHQKKTRRTGDVNLVRSLRRYI